MALRTNGGLRWLPTIMADPGHNPLPWLPPSFALGHVAVATLVAQGLVRRRLEARSRSADRGRHPRTTIAGTSSSPISRGRCASPRLRSNIEDPGSRAGLPISSSGDAPRRRNAVGDRRHPKLPHRVIHWSWSRLNASWSTSWVDRTSPRRNALRAAETGRQLPARPCADHFSSGAGSASALVERSAPAIPTRVDQLRWISGRRLSSAEFIAEIGPRSIPPFLLLYGPAATSRLGLRAVVAS